MYYFFIVVCTFLAGKWEITIFILSAPKKCFQKVLWRRKVFRMICPMVITKVCISKWNFMHLAKKKFSFVPELSKQNIQLIKAKHNCSDIFMVWKDSHKHWHPSKFILWKESYKEWNPPLTICLFSVLLKIWLLNYTKFKTYTFYI